MQLQTLVRTKRNPGKPVLSSKAHSASDARFSRIKNWKHFLVALLILSSLLSLTFNLWQRDTTAACFNADEAAFGYNAYSILTTGRDEYGTLLPLRLKSFGDFKMPLYSYLVMPIIGIFGLSDLTVRSLNTLVSLAYPLLVYAIALSLFKRKRTALIAAFLTAGNVGLHIVGRHTHEAYVSNALILLAVLGFLKSLSSKTWRWWIIMCGALGFSLFAYQSSRLYAALIVGASIVAAFAKRISVKHVIVLILVLALLSIPDIVYKPARVSNLLFFKSPGFEMQVEEYRGEGGPALLFNKATVGAKKLAQEHFRYFSAQYLTVTGDENYRFGYPDMSLITIIEFLFFFTGLVALFGKRERMRWFLVLALLGAPIAGSLSWAGISLTRTVLLLPFILITAAYGMDQVGQKLSTGKTGRGVLGVMIAGQVMLLLYGWNVFLYHYPARDEVMIAQQCGYHELVSSLSTKYPSANRVYISKSQGQPYIYLLFYNKIPPDTYQKEALLGSPDKYGFGQVEGFGKYVFELPELSNVTKGDVLVGTPGDLDNDPRTDLIPREQLQWVTYRGVNMFWIYQVAK